jgi:hypothetical protein
LVSNNVAGAFFPGSELRSLGNTGIKVTPLCIGAPRVEEESLIRYALDKALW